MPDFMPVSLQNIMHSRQSDLREGKIGLIGHVIPDISSE